MRPIGRHAAAGGLALALALSATVPAGGDPAPAPSEGCLGETFHVAIEYHRHSRELLSAAGGVSPTGFLNTLDKDFTLRGTYVRELRDGKPRWVSRKVEWNAQYMDIEPACERISCDAGGQLELGPTDGGAESMSPEQRDQMTWHCQPIVKFGNCFRLNVVYPPRLPFPDIRGTRDTLRIGSYPHAQGPDRVLPYATYVAVDRDGTRYSEWVEQRGNEQISISAEPTEIDPNAKRCVDGKTSIPCPGEATSQLTMKATCSGVPLADREIGLRVDVTPRSGYHNHVEGRPRGKLAVGETEADCGEETGALPETMDDLSCITVKTDANGEAKVQFKSPLTDKRYIDWAKYGAYYSGIAGDYKITAKDAQITEVRASTMVHAKVEGLQLATFDDDLDHSEPSPAHPENFYGTPGTVIAFSKLAKAFRQAQEDHNVKLEQCLGRKARWKIVPLSMNDIALHTGGVFDWHKTWRPSHQTHNKGEGGDFNRFGAPDATNWQKFGTECDGSTPSLLVWDLQVLLDLGKNYGQWDCSDLGAGEYSIFAPDACAKGEIPKVGENITGPVSPSVDYYPPLLHLHVED